MGKTRLNWSQLFVCSSPTHIVQLLFLAQLELLNKFWRTWDANVKADEFRTCDLYLTSLENLDLGLKTKFVVHHLSYNFYLRSNSTTDTEFKVLLWSKQQHDKLLN
jgi:hypothetical protein